MFSRSEIGLEMHTIFDAIRVMEDNLIALTIILYRHLQKVIALYSDPHRENVSVFSDMIQHSNACKEQTWSWRASMIKSSAAEKKPEMEGLEWVFMCFSQWAKDHTMNELCWVQQDWPENRHHASNAVKAFWDSKPACRLMVLPTEAYVEL